MAAAGPDRVPPLIVALERPEYD
ncbi:hypothetical protein CPAR01_15836 [Colletotrichum paranaense]|uniref:Uncharacterized protein n=1 Tax=Colletotrichum paranaense TaxID=1914294 RepID=A0ABQ9RY17_9PEZI|nr:hypothetical protein CPAR01_15836 [Colletotrichum paranaense]